MNSKHFITNRNEIFNEIFLTPSFMLIHVKRKESSVPKEYVRTQAKRSCPGFLTAVVPRTFNLLFRCIYVDCTHVEGSDVLSRSTLAVVIQPS